MIREALDIVIGLAYLHGLLVAVMLGAWGLGALLRLAS